MGNNCFRQVDFHDGRSTGTRGCPKLPLTFRKTLPGMPSLLLLLAMLSCGLAFAGPAVLGVGSGRLDLQPHLWILLDHDSALTSDQVTSAEMRSAFKPVSSTGNSFGFSDATFWLRFTLGREQDREMVLELAHASIDEVTLFAPDGKGGLRPSRGGESLPFVQRPIAYRTHLFLIEAAGEQREYYLRVRSEGSVQLPLILWTTRGFIEHLDRSGLALGVYYGAMFLLLLAALASYIRVHDRLFLHYAIYLASYLWFQLSINGYAFQYLWPALPDWSSRLTAISVGAVCLGGLLFSGTFLGLWENHARLARLHRIYMGFALIGIAWNLVGDYVTGVKLVTLAGLLLPFVVLTAAIRVALLGGHSARVFLVAWCIFLVGVFAAALLYLGFLPSNFLTVYAVQIGSLVEILLLTYVLTARIEQLRSEKEKTIRDAKEKLELMVAERTHELEVKNQVLKDLAIRDSLTGLLNHKASLDLLQVLQGSHARSGRPLVVMMLDIDHFKPINDRFGHLAGDEVIREVAEVLRRNTCETDGCGRVGGEEFMIILPGTTRSRAVELAERIRRIVSELKIEQIESRGVTISIGIAVAGQQSSASSLATAADRALYAAKAAGRNRVKVADEQVDVDFEPAAAGLPKTQS